MNSCKPHKIFITGTDTEVGKTLMTSAMLAALSHQGISCQGLKPIASGCLDSPDGLLSEDAALLAKYSSNQPSIDDINPIRFKAPIAPHIAAKNNNKRITSTEIRDILEQQPNCDLLLIEGFGGWQVPINEHEMMADLVAACIGDVILVVGLKLGCLNHALLSQQAIEATGCRIVGWVANQIHPDMLEVEANITTLTQHLKAPPLAMVPFQQHANPSVVSQYFAADFAQKLLKSIVS